MSSAGWDPKPPGLANLHVVFAPPADGPDPAVLARLERLRPAIAEATREVQSLTFLLLFVGLYIGVVAGTTDHRMLLVGAQIQMPFLGVGVSLVGAYFLAPLLFLLLHFWLLRTLLALATRVNAYALDLRGLPEPWANEARRLVPAFPYVEWRLGGGRQTLAALVCMFLYVVLPLGLLLLIQLKFLPYQHDWLTPWHMLCLVACVALLWLTWPTIDGPAQSRRLRVLGVGGSMAVLVASAMLYLDQRPPALAWLAPELIRRADEAGWPAYELSRLSVTDEILMKREPAAELLAAVRDRTKPQATRDAQTEVFLDRELAEPLSLAGRNLRRADLSRSRLLGVALEGADLRGAALVDADLISAHGNARTSLASANLQGARLGDAKLRGADLGKAQLQGANLYQTQLQGADLQEARLWGAYVYRAQLQGADLRLAQLQGALLESADLDGADLKGALLYVADLLDANLRGADLRGAQLWKTELDHRSDLSLSFLDGASTAAPGDEVVARLSAELERAIHPARANPDWRELLQHRDQPRDPKERPVAVAAFVGPAPDPGITALAGPGLALEEYRPKLVAFLVRLACSDQWIAKGIARGVTGPPPSWPSEIGPLLAQSLLASGCEPVTALDAGQIAAMRVLATNAP